MTIACEIPHWFNINTFTWFNDGKIDLETLRLALQYLVINKLAVCIDVLST